MMKGNIGALLRKHMNEKSARKVGYSIEIRIFDRRGAKAFEWRPGQGNLILGIMVMTEFVEKKIGINIREYQDMVFGPQSGSQNSPQKRLNLNATTKEGVCAVGK